MWFLLLRVQTGQQHQHNIMSNVSPSKCTHKHIHHLSASQCNNVKQSASKWRRRYVCGEKEKSRHSMQRLEWTMFELVYQKIEQKSFDLTCALLFSAIMAFASVSVRANEIASHCTMYVSAMTWRWFLFWFIGVIHLVNFSVVCLCAFLFGWMVDLCCVWNPVHDTHSMFICFRKSFFFFHRNKRLAYANRTFPHRNYGSK